MSENNGRNSKGQFVKGNAGGPGNPFARHMAKFRAKLMEEVTDEDFEKIAFQLVMMAKAGNMDAIKLLFNYIMGKPTQTVDPDRLDHMELEMHREGKTTAEDIEKTLDNMPVQHAVEFARVSKEAFYDRETEVRAEKRRRKAESRLRRRQREMVPACYEPPGYMSIEEEFGLVDEPTSEPTAMEVLLKMQEILARTSEPSTNGERKPSTNGERKPSTNGERQPSTNGERKPSTNGH